MCLHSRPESELEMRLSIFRAQLIGFRSLILAVVFLLPQISHGFDKLEFFSFEHVRTETDARDRMVRFEVSRSSPLLLYELRETPTGSLAPAVKSIEFQRELELTDPEADSFFKRVVAAGLFSL